MAISAYVLNNVTGKLTLLDGTGTPVTLEVPFYGGDLTVSGVRKVLNEPINIEARGHNYGKVYGARMYPELAFSCFIPEFTNASVGVVFDFLNNQGAYAANVSVWGATRPYAVNARLEIEGSSYGGNDVTVTFAKFTPTLDIAEAVDGNKLSVSGECDSISGDITAAGIA
jgi:hypothetical protein